MAIPFMSCRPAKFMRTAMVEFCMNQSSSCSRASSCFQKSRDFVLRNDRVVENLQPIPARKGLLPRRYLSAGQISPNTRNLSYSFFGLRAYCA